MIAALRYKDSLTGPPGSLPALLDYECGGIYIRDAVVAGRCGAAVTGGWAAACLQADGEGGGRRGCMGRRMWPTGWPAWLAHRSSTPQLVSTVKWSRGVAELFQASDVGWSGIKRGHIPTIHL